MEKIEVIIQRTEATAWVRLRGALRAPSAEELIGAIPDGVGAGRLLVVDLREVQAADSVAAGAMSARLRQVGRIACLLPSPWCPAAALLRRALAEFPAYERLADLAAAEGVPLPAPEPRERRRFPRVAVRLPAEVTADGGARCAGWTADISAGGVRMEPGRPISGGALDALRGRAVAMKIARLPLRARVVRVDAGPPPSLGLALTGRSHRLEMLLDTVPRAGRP